MTTATIMPLDRMSMPAHVKVKAAARPPFSELDNDYHRTTMLGLVSPRHIDMVDSRKGLVQMLKAAVRKERRKRAIAGTLTGILIAADVIVGAYTQIPGLFAVPAILVTAASWKLTSFISNKRVKPAENMLETAQNRLTTAMRDGVNLKQRA